MINKKLNRRKTSPGPRRLKDRDSDMTAGRNGGLHDGLYKGLDKGLDQGVDKEVDKGVHKKVDTGMNKGGGVAGKTDNASTPPDKMSSTPSFRSYSMPPRAWFFTFMCMNIPIIGWIYLLTKAFGKKETPLKDFSRAYLLYKLVFLAVALVILGIAVYIGLGILDKLLAYMEML